LGLQVWSFIGHWELGIGHLDIMITNLLLLTGPDDFRLKQRMRFYEKAFQKKYPDGEVEHLGGEKEFSDLDNAACTPNLFGGRKLLITQDFWNAEVFEQAEKAEFFEKLPSFSDNCTVIIVEPKLDKRLKFSKFLLTSSKAETFEELDEVSLLRWIEEHVKAQGGRISRANAQGLMKRCGTNLWNLSKEIEKLITSGEGEITAELIEELTLPNPSAVMWDFLEQVSKKRATSAIKQMQDLRLSGVSLHEIFSMLFREVRIHAQIRSGIEQNMEQRKIASVTKLHPFVVQKTMPLSRNFSEKQIQTMYDHLFAIDKKLKTGGISTSTDDASEFELAVEKFIIEASK
jgi:DNA polymerase-3 subunit delta